MCSLSSYTLSQGPLVDVLLLALSPSWMLFRPAQTRGFGPGWTGMENKIYAAEPIIVGQAFE